MAGNTITVRVLAVIYLLLLSFTRLSNDKQEGSKQSAMKRVVQGEWLDGSGSGRASKTREAAAAARARSSSPLQPPLKRARDKAGVRKRPAAVSQSSSLRPMSLFKKPAKARGRFSK